jgi:hypothetical protein
MKGQKVTRRPRKVAVSSFVLVEEGERGRRKRKTTEVGQTEEEEDGFSTDTNAARGSQSNKEGWFAGRRIQRTNRRNPLLRFPHADFVTMSDVLGHRRYDVK